MIHLDLRGRQKPDPRSPQVQSDDPQVLEMLSKPLQGQKKPWHWGGFGAAKNRNFGEHFQNSPIINPLDVFFGVAIP
jgi:hypothetical protein